MAPADDDGPQRRSDDLAAYRAKRSIDRTSEPFGRPNPAEAGVFVVQQHAARRMHWDLRLEMDGVLKSWAVPRGISADPNEKRLAVHTEDHPIEYQDYEGVIPDGNYGAGAMIVWDKGVWTPLEEDKNGGHAAHSIESGKLLFELRGYKLRGVWTLFRIRSKATSGRDEGNEWLLVKKPDAWARGPEEDEYPQQSVFSGLTVDELRQSDRRSRELRETITAEGVPKGTVDPARQRPMLAQVGDRPFSDEEWVFELKYDGFRLLAAKVAGQAHLYYRRGAEATHLFPDVARALRALPVDSLLLDGEVVVLDDESRPSFQRLQKRTQLTRSLDIQRAAARLPATYFAFDLLSFEDYDLRDLPMVERKRLLEPLMPPAGPLRYCDHVVGRGEDFYGAVQQMQLEGMVAKRADSTYRAGRSPNWLKIRVDRRADLAIVGMSPPRGGRPGFGALHLAYWDAEREDGPGLSYAGRVGTGFSDAQLDQIHAALVERRRDTPPCTGPVPQGRSHVWVEPELVCEVRYKEWTEEGLLRQPAFLGLRPDKTVEECHLSDRRAPAEEIASLQESDVDRPPAVELTNLTKVFWPVEGYTKGDLIEYYRAVADHMLPFLRDRPLVLTRYPDGIEGKNFYQKHAPDFAPDWIQVETIYSEHSERDIEYFVCQDIDSLTYIANLGAILLHIWSSQLETLAAPDWCILDLDPKQAPFSDVIEVALATKRLCDDIGMPSYVKTSGSTGLHVLLPLGRQCTYEQSRQLGELISRVVAEENPEIATLTRVIDRREGKVYLDYVQNGHGRLLVAPFTLRPLPGAPVSTPLRWSEVGPKLRMDDHDIRTVPQRLARQRKDPWEGLLTRRPDLVAILAALAERAPG